MRELARQGHEVAATFRAAGEEGYEGERKRRVADLSGVCRRVFSAPFGGAKFLRLAAERPGWDALCHHAALAGNFRAAGYDPAAALAANTRRLPQTLQKMRAGGCGAIVLTGSVFERGEGKGAAGLPAILPYGLAKTMTSEAFVFYAKSEQMRLGKFVIPNPFGPMEDDSRFTAFLLRQWQNGESAEVRAPDYVRDNIHISLLALCYADFVRAFVSGRKSFAAAHPSGYAEKQSDFARRFAREMRKRLHLPCRLQFAKQTQFPEPRARVNTDTPNPAALQWSEKAAWDAIAQYAAKRKAPLS